MLKMVKKQPELHEEKVKVDSLANELENSQISEKDVLKRATEEQKALVENAV